MERRKPMIRNTTLCLAAAAALLAAPALAQTAPHPALATGVMPAPQYIPAQGDYVVTNDTPLYQQPVYRSGTETGVTLKRGEHPKVLAETDGGLWLLIGGSNGKGIGYAPRSLMCPAKLCPGLKS
jgi:hypothetical protein